MKKNTVLKIVGAITIVVAIIASFLAGCAYSYEETSKEARIASVRRRARYYTRMVENTPSTRIDEVDRKAVLEIFEDNEGWFEAGFRIDYEMSYVDSEGVSWIGRCSGNPESFIEDLGRCEWIDVISISKV